MENKPSDANQKPKSVEPLKAPGLQVHTCVKASTLKDWIEGDMDSNDIPNWNNLKKQKQELPP